MRKAESMIMLGPVLERIDNEGLKPAMERVFNIMSRAGIFPPAPQEIAGRSMEIEFVSMLAQAQDAAQAASIERVLGLAGNLVGVKPEIMDNIDTDFSLDKYSSLLSNDPRMIRSPDAVAKIREERAQAAQAEQQAAQADAVQKYAASAKNLAATPVSGGGSALDALTQ